MSTSKSYSLPSRAEVVIIGGGILGISTALHLAKRGATDVILLEKDTLCSGQTHRSSAIITTVRPTDALIRVAKDSTEIFRDFPKRMGGQANFVSTGHLLLFSPGRRPAFADLVAKLKRNGVQAKVLDNREILEIEPRLSLEGIEGALWDPTAGYADPSLTASSFSKAALEIGVKIFERTQVTEIAHSGGRVTGVKTPHGDIGADNVLLAGGAWGPTLARTAGVELPVYRHRATMLQVTRPKDFGKDHPFINDPVIKIYFRPEGLYSTLAGNVESLLKVPQELEQADPDTFRQTGDDDVLASMAERLSKRMPALANSVVKRSYCCVYDVSPDWHPIVDETSEVRGLYVMEGTSGGSFSISPTLGRMMAEFISTGRKPEDIGELRLSRFKEKTKVLPESHTFWLFQDN